MYIYIVMMRWHITKYRFIPLQTHQMTNTYEQQKAIAHQEYVLELIAFEQCLKSWRWFSSEIHQNDREINEDDDSIIEFNSWEIVFDTKEKTATIKQYFDWEYNAVSRLVKRDDEDLWEFLARAEELNEKLRNTICFETR